MVYWVRISFSGRVGCLALLFIGFGLFIRLYSYSYFPNETVFGAFLVGQRDCLTAMGGRVLPIMAT